MRTATKRKQWDFKKTAFDIKMESTKAKNRIKAKLSKDPKQIAKASIKELYLDWKVSAPKRYSSNAEFARDMQKKFTDENEIEIIKSSKNKDQKATIGGLNILRKNDKVIISFSKKTINHN